MTSPDEPWLNEDEQAAWRAFLEAHAAMVRELDRRLKARTGCSLSDYEVLVNLSEAQGGSLRASDLARAMGWDRSRLSHHLARMEARGHVARSRVAEDRRGVEVALTAAGRRAIRAAAPAHAADVRELFVTPLGRDVSRVATALTRITRAGNS